MQYNIIIAYEATRTEILHVTEFLTCIHCIECSIVADTALKCIMP
jgi:hypothetical protein